MKCPFCTTTVTNNADFSQHMNKDHRGKPYRLLDSNPLNKAKDNSKA